MNKEIIYVSKAFKKEGIDFEFKTAPPFPFYKGSYVLVVEIKKDKRIRIGKLGEFLFKKGLYFYVGSAQGGIKRRIQRYFKKRKTKWHIDYLIRAGEVTGVFLFKEMSEDVISNIMRKFMKEYIKGFGSSDKRCFSHLFTSREVSTD